jgi:hypothetical protein
MRLLCLLSTLASLAACSGGTAFVPGDQGTDGTPPGQEAAVPDLLPHRDYPVDYACDTVDILFVVDNSNTMELEQENLAANFPKFIQAIEAIQPPIKSYHVGVISTDIGAGPYNDPLLGACKPGGDGGKLQHAPHGASCAASYPRYLEGPAPDLAKDFACIARLGLGGCGFEQQMEAALTALTSQTYNQGFIRKNAPLAIIFITDEDDCSARDSTIFDPKATAPFPSRCVKQTAKLHPVSRYIQGFKALKDDAKRLVVAAITGPPGTVELDPLKNTVKPQCSSKLGSAAPGNRFGELTKGFGERGLLESICQDDLSNSLQVIGKAIKRTCLK